MTSNIPLYFCLNVSSQTTAASEGQMSNGFTEGSTCVYHCLSKGTVEFQTMYAPKIKDAMLWTRPLGPLQLSVGALQQTVAAAARRTLVLTPEPVHHVTGVAPVSTAQAEVGWAADGYVADGALEGQTFANGTLRPTSLTAAVTAVHTELYKK